MTATVARSRPGASQDRLEKAARCRELRDQGLLQREIAEALGFGLNWVNELLNDPDGAKKRARVDSYAGVCMDCGGPTDGSLGPKKTPKRCASCALAFEREDIAWTPERVIESFQRFHAEHGRSPLAMDLNPWLALQIAKKVTDPVKRARYEEVFARWKPGEYPTHGTVLRRFGTFPAALAAAGLPLNDRQARWTRESVIAEIRRRSVDGVAPSSNDDIALQRAAFYHFGNWRKAVEAAGLDLLGSGSKQRITHEEVIAGITRYRIRYGQWPKTTAYRLPRHGLPSYPTITKLFGKWRYAVSAAQAEWNGDV
jgi:hypothetical protein